MCAGLEYKLGSVSHSLRLTSSTWKSVAEQISGTCTWTGDLGTERRISLYYGSLLRLHGTWIQVEDDEGGVQEQRKPDDESGFRVEAAFGALGPMEVDDEEETTDFAFEAAQGPRLLHQCILQRETCQHMIRMYWMDVRRFIYLGHCTSHPTLSRHSETLSFVGRGSYPS